MKRVTDTSGADVSAAFDTYMASDDGKSFVIVDLFTITLLTLGWPRDSTGSGLTLRYATSEYDIQWGGHTFLGGYAYAGLADHDPSPRLERGTIKTVIGTEVGTMTLSFYLDGTELLPPAATGANPFGLAEAIGAGIFEGAHVRAERLFLKTHPSYVGGLRASAISDVAIGSIVLFAGQVTDTKLTRSKGDLTVSSYAIRWNMGFPVHVYQPQCRWTLYDVNCTFSRTGTVTKGIPSTSTASAQLVGTVAASPTPTQVIVGVTSSLPTAFFALGTLQMTSGAMAGLQRPLKGWANLGGITWAELLIGLPRVPVVGDGVIVQAGCDKSEDACFNQFNNLANFGGFPKTPPADSAV